MGNGINNYMSLIANLAKSSAAMQNDKEKIDTKAEFNSYVSGWDAIKKDAEAKNSSEAQIDMSALETDMKSELASLMGAEFGKSAGVEAKGENGKPVFSAEDISLENMMKLLAPEDGLDIGKTTEYVTDAINNGSAAEIAKDTKAMEDDMTKLRDAFYEEDKRKAVFSAKDISLENMMALLKSEDGLNIGKTTEYTTKAIGDGSAARIAKDTAIMEDDMTKLRDAFYEEDKTGAKKDAKEFAPDYAE